MDWSEWGVFLRSMKLVSSVAVRVQLEAALEFAREGDVLVVTKLDRLARSVADVMTIVQTLDRKTVGLRILNLGMDTQTPTGKPRQYYVVVALAEYLSTRRKQHHWRRHLQEACVGWHPLQ